MTGYPCRAIPSTKLRRQALVQSATSRMPVALSFGCGRGHGTCRDRAFWTLPLPVQVCAAPTLRVGRCAFPERGVAAGSASSATPRPPARPSLPGTRRTRGTAGTVRGLPRPPASNGAFARAFKAEVQPVEIASALQREINDRAAVDRPRPHRHPQRLPRRALRARLPATGRVQGRPPDRARPRSSATTARSSATPSSARSRSNLGQDDELETGIFRVRSEARAEVARSRTAASTGRQRRSPASRDSRSAAPPTRWCAPSAGWAAAATPTSGSRIPVPPATTARSSSASRCPRPRPELHQPAPFVNGQRDVAARDRRRHGHHDRLDPTGRSGAADRCRSSRSPSSGWDSSRCWWRSCSSAVLAPASRPAPAAAECTPSGRERRPCASIQAAQAAEGGQAEQKVKGSKLVVDRGAADRDDHPAGQRADHHRPAHRTRLSSSTTTTRRAVTRASTRPRDPGSSRTSARRTARGSTARGSPPRPCCPWAPAAGRPARRCRSRSRRHGPRPALRRPLRRRPDPRGQRGLRLRRGRRCSWSPTAWAATPPASWPAPSPWPPSPTSTCTRRTRATSSSALGDSVADVGDGSPSVIAVDPGPRPAWARR